MNIIIYSAHSPIYWRGFKLVRYDNKFYWCFSREHVYSHADGYPPTYLMGPNDIYDAWHHNDGRHKRKIVYGNNSRLIEYLEGDLDCFTSTIGNP